MEIQNYPPGLRTLIERHGHLCIGSAIGYRVCRYALKLVDRGTDLKVFTGSGGCLLHAIEIVTGCSRENGSVVDTEYPGWGFCDNTSGEGYRFILKAQLLQHYSGDKDGLINALLSLPDNNIFDVEAFELPDQRPEEKEPPS